MGKYITYFIVCFKWHLLCGKHSMHLTIFILILIFIVILSYCIITLVKQNPSPSSYSLSVIKWYPFLHFLFYQLLWFDVTQKSGINSTKIDKWYINYILVILSYNKIKRMIFSVICPHFLIYPFNYPNIKHFF